MPGRREPTSLMGMPTRRNLIAGSAAIAAGTLIGTPAAASTRSKPTVVLVHGAFADASGWNDVARILLHHGHRVIAPANPLRGLAADSAYLASVLGTLPGPLVLVGHSYGGMVITNAARDNPHVTALVYVAAFAPDAGETLHELQVRYTGTKLDESALDFRPHPGGYDGYVKPERFREVFAADLPRHVTDLMAVTQRPGDTTTLGEPSGVPAWRTIPSHFLIARDDNLIPAAAQRFMATRAGARTVEVKASHVAMMSQPRATAALIRKAAR
ncbi:pimeloyl-ACP methyl ester carboxylesterase [Actinoplanes xinjiangensis]|uniref:Pimeloyl-ACP methyl ester carboxylesterase n=2 Tax=Actinoplanes xinjiangensis TaxID=512350 RepID=A0A316F5F9_9ACTN|nr:pimeloyl-ACP methyl ester carboxylesterase [Actinoplanes xinjiangensis]GIF42721.1 alpha/beta hydrolase [Actinoplanes xinjiangensis]